MLQAWGLAAPVQGTAERRNSVILRFGLCRFKGSFCCRLKCLGGVHPLQISVSGICARGHGDLFIPGSSDQNVPVISDAWPSPPQWLCPAGQDPAARDSLVAHNHNNIQYYYSESYSLILLCIDYFWVYIVKRVKEECCVGLINNDVKVIKVDDIHTYAIRETDSTQSTAKSRNAFCYSEEKWWSFH